MEIGPSHIDSLISPQSNIPEPSSSACPTEMSTVNDDVNSMNDMEVPTKNSDPLQVLLNYILSSNKPELWQSAVKQVSKLLQAIAKKNDKKTRQLRTDNIIIKKYVTSIVGMVDLQKYIGFEELEIEGKQYLSISEDHNNIVNMESLSQRINDAKTVDVAAASAAEDGSAVEAKPVLCKSNCGFYGNPKQDGYCSKCYKLELNRQITSTASSNTPVSTQCQSTGCKNKSVILNATNIGKCQLCQAVEEGTTQKCTIKQKFKRAVLKLRVVILFESCKRPVQADKERCWTCKRKLNLSGVECRCGYVFCGKHRYADEHHCTYDHYKRHMASLAKQNQIVKNAKFERFGDD